MKIALLFFLLLSPLVAHLEGGSDLEVGRWMIDFSYSSKTPQPKESITMMFNLVNKSTDTAVNTDSIWVKISKQNKLFFSGEIKSGNFGTLTYLFPESGEYDVLLQFRQENESVEGLFKVDVKNKQEFPILFVLAGIPALIGALKLKKQANS